MNRGKRHFAYSNQWLWGHICLTALIICLLVALSPMAAAEIKVPTLHNDPADLSSKTKEIEQNKDIGLLKKNQAAQQVALAKLTEEHNIHDLKFKVHDKTFTVFKQWLENEIRKVDNWLKFLALFLTVTGGTLVIVCIVLPRWITRNLKAEYQNALDQMNSFLNELQIQFNKAVAQPKPIAKEIENITEIPPNQQMTAGQIEIVEKISADPQAPSQAVLIARALEKQSQKKWKEAIAYWKVLLDLCPHDPSAYFGLGFSLHNFSRGCQATARKRIFSKAMTMYQKVVELDPTHHPALLNWGEALYEQAKMTNGLEKDRLLKQSCTKYSDALKIEPDICEALDNWGLALFEQAKSKKEPEATALFEEARKKFFDAEALCPGFSAYNVVCVSAQMDNPSACKEWLEICLKTQNMPDCKQLREDSDLDPVRQQGWFKEFMDKVCKEDKVS